MTVYVAIRYTYVPDCPADLEVTGDEILGVFGTLGGAEEAFDLYKANIIRLNEGEREDPDENWDYPNDGYFHIHACELDANDYWAPWWPPKKETTTI